MKNIDLNSRVYKITVRCEDEVYVEQYTNYGNLTSANKLFELVRNLRRSQMIKFKYNILFAVCTVFLTVLHSVAVVYGFDIPEPTKAFYVNDYTNTLSSGTTKRILTRSLDTYSERDIQLVTVIVDDIQVVNIETYAAAISESWGIGSKKAKRGLCFLVNKNQNTAYIDIGEGLLNYISLGKMDDILQESFYGSAGDLNTAVYNTVISIINSLSSVPLETEEYELSFVEKYNLKAYIPIAIGLGGILILFIFVKIIIKLAKKKKVNPYIPSHFEVSNDDSGDDLRKQRLKQAAELRKANLVATQQSTGDENLNI